MTRHRLQAASRNLRVERSLIAAGCLAYGLLFAISVLRYEAVQKLIRNDQLALHSEMVERNLNGLEAQLERAMSSARAYDLTGETRYQDEYHDALASGRELTAAVRQLTGDNPDQQKRMNNLTNLLAADAEKMQQVLLSGRDQIHMQKPSADLIDQAEDLTAKIRIVTQRASREERNLLRVRSTEAEASARGGLDSGMMGTLLSMILIGLAGFFLYREVMHRRSAEEKIRKLNQGLEETVHERTEELRNSEARYRTLFEESPHPKWVYDLETLGFLAVNQAAVRHYGYSRAEFLAMTLGNILPLEDVSAFLKGNHVGDAESSKTRVQKHRKKDGTLMWVEVTAHALTFDERRAALLVATDCTERLLAQQQVQALNASLEQRVAERTLQLRAANQELEAFGYSVSHDLRAPLRQISGFAKILNEDYGRSLDEEAGHYLDRIVEGILHMEHVLQALLVLGRVGRQELSRRPSDLGELARKVAAGLTSENGVRAVEWKLGPLSVVECDPVLIRQVLENLLSNAFKFTRGKERAVIEVGEMQMGTKRAFYVRDNGAGFDMKYSGKLFQAFQRLHRPDEFEGTGIGLATVRRIVQKHGGEVWAESEVGSGTTIYFTLSPGGHISEL